MLREKVSRLVPGSVFTIIIAGLALLVWFEVTHVTLQSAELTKYEEPLKTAVQMMLDVSKSYTGWAAAIIAAGTLYVKSAIEKPGLLSQVQVASLFVVVAGAVVCIFFGQLAAERTYLLIYVQQNPLTDDRLLLFLRMQYLCGLTSLGLFGFFLFHVAWCKMISTGA